MKLKFQKGERVFIEFLEVSKETTNQCTRQIGEMPEKAPDLEFQTEGEKKISTYKDVIDDFEDLNEYEY